MCTSNVAQDALHVQGRAVGSGVRRDWQREDRHADGLGAGSFSNPHISARAAPTLSFLDGRTWRASATVLPGGLTAKAPGRRPPPPAVPHLRGKVSGFSVASRRRLRLALMGIDWPHVSALWVTLTYPKAWPADWQVSKAHLRAFLEAVRRNYPTTGLIWRLEQQRRGAPHYHMVLGYPLGAAPDARAFEAWAAGTWLRIVGATGRERAKHAVYGTRVVAVERHGRGDLGALMSYLTKELCKVKQNREESGGTGRQWGIRGHFPTRIIGEVELSDAGYTELARRVAESSVGWMHEALSGRWSGFTFFGDGEAFWETMLRDLPGGVRIVSGFGIEGSPEDVGAPQAHWRR